MPCVYQLKSGKRKGTHCGKETPLTVTLCRRHETALRKSELAQTALRCVDTLDVLHTKLLSINTSPENMSVILKKFRYVESLPSTSNEYQKNLNWLRHAMNFPFNKHISIPVLMEGENATEEISNYVSEVYDRLDSYIYGMHDVKEELMSFVCKRISNPNSVDHVLAIQGSNGCGKTRLAHGLAKALDLPIRTINLGGVNDVGAMVGHSFTFVESEPGRIVQILSETGCQNPIIYFDELDKIHKTEKGAAINGFLTHAIDGTQNAKYQDMYLGGLVLDISKVFFVFSFNDESALDHTVKDRLKIIRVKEPTFDEKVAIALKFLIPEICQNLNFQVEISEETVKQVVRHCKGKSGLRELKRIFEDIIGRMNVKRMMTGSKKRMSYFDISVDKMIMDVIQRHGSESTGMSMYL